jgi:hypothetical protein
MDIGDVLPPTEATYGEETSFAKGSRLAYPDFSLKLLGTTRSLPITHWCFEVHAGNETVEVESLTGGVRDSTVFAIAGKHFTLDLRKLGRDESWTVVVTPT